MFFLEKLFIVIIHQNLTNVACDMIKICDLIMNEVDLVKINIFWFRRDLRIDDNMALGKCILEGREILPIYIIENELLDEAVISQPRILFLFSALMRLSEKLEKMNSKLFIYKGKPKTVIQTLCKQMDVESIYFNRNYEPKELEVDREIWEKSKKKGIDIKSFKDQVLHERGEILKKDKTPYSVFSYYYKKWQSLEKDDCKKIEPFQTVQFTAIKECTLPDSVGFFTLSPEIDFDFFLNNKLNGYAENRDYPYLDGTSKISAYLATGMLSVRKVYHSVRALSERGCVVKSQGIDTFIKQLAWRDFYYQILYHFTHVENGPFIKKFHAIKWDNDHRLFHHWCNGTTGIPIVDAGMRQLNQEGWMHNRLRMITASFLTKDLLIDWKWGEKYFKENLIDYDLPLNNGGWQWCASTGTDAQPYFRIFNPLTQSKKFDPNGQFIKKYIPELMQVEEKYIHQPFEMSERQQRQSGCMIGKDYPYPVVDHSEQRKKALKLYKDL